MANGEDSNPARPSLFRELSYVVHTNRELEFMLDGHKPLATFTFSMAMRH